MMFARRFSPVCLLLASWSLPQLALSAQPQTETAPVFSSSGKQHPAPGTSITHFAQVDTSVYLGSKPKSSADFEFLRSKNIRYILNVKFLPFLTGPEKAKAKRYGIEFLSVLMNASPVAPCEKHVDEALRMMRTHQPIYVHCVLGRDRTNLLGGLYRMYFLGVSRQKAWSEMKQDGFRDVWFLKGLSHYFEKHSTAPPDLADLAEPAGR